MFTTVLVAEDFEPFRQLLSLLLEKQPTLKVVAEVADGFHAVEKASALRPDLILLDIGLPRLSGIDAARQIKASSPGSKIIFVSDHREAEIVREGLARGAMAYVLKSDAARELHTAIDAALRGETFLSSSIANC